MDVRQIDFLVVRLSLHVLDTWPAQKTVDSRAVTNVYGVGITCHCGPCIHNPSQAPECSECLVDSFRQLESCAKLWSTGRHNGHRVTEYDDDHVGRI